MSSRKHWPSMFMKSKSSTESSNPLQETSHSSAMRRPYSEGATLHNHGRERERTPPRARSRWNPKPEQIRILEDLFRSGLVNPPREEIKSIRAQLEKFGEVADASVFYWFQNRKSRIKRRQRQLEAAQRSKSRAETVIPSSTPSTPTSTSIQSRSMTDLSYTPAANTIHSNIGDQYYPSAVPVSSFAGHHSDPQAVPSAVPVSSFVGHHSDPQAVPSAVQVSSFAGHHSDPQVVYDEISNYNEFSNMQAKGAGVATTAQGMSNEEPGGVHDSIVNTNPLITVFINDNPITVPMGPLNMRAYFGDDVLLFHSSGKLVLVNEWGFTTEGLNPGANYFTI